MEVGRIQRVGECSDAGRRMATPDGPLDSRSSSPQKIALFRSLFRGRDDVYPQRFESRRTGRCGYAPACANEWVRGICEKPQIKCAECPNRRFLPVTDDVIRWHLSGQDDAGQQFVAGVYPMLLDETCYFLAVDFDKQGWRADATAFLETCRRMDLPATLERSRSGRGAHVWLFFEEAVPAALARKLGASVLTETMERRPDLGLDSYDPFFPNQDTLPHGGFGNLIALPLQKHARTAGNTLFLDNRLEPYRDQWAFLSTVEKLGRTRIERVTGEAERRGRVVGVRLPGDEHDEPWITPPSRHRKEPPILGELPGSLELIIANEIYIAKDDLVPGLRNRLLRLAAFQNPEFYRAQAMRLSTYDKPRIVACAEEHARHISVPRGCLEEVRQLLADLNISAALHDERCAGQHLDVTFQGSLRPDQTAAAQAMLAHDTGVLAATTAFGKTIIAAWLIAQRGVNTLVLVHRRQLLDQWVDRLSGFLNTPSSAIGRLSGGHHKRTGLLDVALIQSLVRKGIVNDCVDEYGHVIVDECHHLSAHSFEQVARRTKAKFVVGLSATVIRKDGHHPIIFMQCGPVRYRVNAKAQAAMRPFDHAVYVRPTAFQGVGTTDIDKRIEFQTLYKELVSPSDESRNRQIAEEVLQALQDRRSPLILTERNDHLDRLATHLSEKVRHLVVLRGGMGKRQRRAIIDRLSTIPSDEARVLLATGNYIGEGFDDPRLDTLFLTLPISWRGTVAQYVGRLHRLYDGKRDVRVYDYADINVPMLARMFDRRCRGYEAIGYRIIVPASTVPGWPADVPLPSDPHWKRDYSASVRRLVRDGVDTTLAGLFLQVAGPISPEAEGAERGRSASEAFLYRRLESLLETKGRFQLNVELSIPFNGWSRMEVDLICNDSRVVVELDGAQHLTDAITYRRDRRKDQLLQENGYLVLRFLAEDLGKELDAVLDAILRSLAHRRQLRQGDRDGKMSSQGSERTPGNISADFEVR